MYYPRALIVSQASQSIIKSVANVNNHRKPAAGRQLKVRLERILLNRVGLDPAIEVQSCFADRHDSRIFGQSRKLGHCPRRGFVGAMRMDSDGGKQAFMLASELYCPAAGSQVKSNDYRHAYTGTDRPLPDLCRVFVEAGRVQVDV